MQRNSSLHMLDKMRRAQQYAPKQKPIFILPRHIKKQRKKVEHKPSFAYKPLPPKILGQIYFLINLISKCYRSLSYQQKVGLIFFMLIGFAAAIDAKNQQTIKPKANKQNALKKICAGESDLFAINKISDMELSLDDDGMMVPTTCITGDSSCTADKSELHHFYRSSAYDGNLDVIEANRAANRHQLQLWQRRTGQEIASFLNTLNADQLPIFEDILLNINTLKLSHLSHKKITEVKGGNCGELAVAALFEILDEKLKHKFEIKIQTANLSSSKKNQYINDHTFLLIDSNVDDFYIEKNAQAVQQFLSQLQGTICDKWNNHYGDFSQLTNKLYHHRKYDSLVIQTITVDFKDFNKLPIEARKFICRELSQMNLAKYNSECPRLGK